mgnify:CR=1 FL=1
MTSGTSRRSTRQTQAPASRDTASRRGARSQRTGLNSRVRAWSRHHRAMARTATSLQCMHSASMLCR